MDNSSNPQEAAPAPQAQQVILPFVQITVLNNGSIQTQTNLKDKSLILGLIETAKFHLMLTRPDPPKIQPANGFAQSMLRRMKP